MCWEKVLHSLFDGSTRLYVVFATAAMVRKRSHVIGRYVATFFSRRVVARRCRRFCCAVAVSFIALAVFLFIAGKWSAMMSKCSPLLNQNK